MNLKYKVLILLIAVFILFRAFRYYSVSEERKVLTDVILPENQVKITVHYEALCPDSKFIIVHHLVPVYKQLSSHILLDLVPYGKAQTILEDGDIKFACQHGEVECYANKIHACVINQVKNPFIMLKYIACMIDDNMNPNEAGERCGTALDIPFEPIKKCANDKEGKQLLKLNGDRTNSLNPKVKFIPTIELNDSLTAIPQAHILKNLHKSVCQLLNVKPNECLV